MNGFLKKTNIKLGLGLFVPFLAALLSSCQDFLRVLPETSLSTNVFYKTENDFTQAVNGAYVPLRGIYNTPAWLLNEQHGDNTYYARNTLFGAVDQTENIADFAIPVSDGVTTNTNVLSIYRQYFQIIARTNQVLATIDEAAFADTLKPNLKGQALFLRAFSYFNLISLFDKVPLHLVPAADRSEAALPLASREEIFTQIEADANEAIELLPTKAEQLPGRVTTGAAQMLLGNLFIVLERWADAEAIFTKLVDSEGYSLMPTYEQAFSTSTTNKNNAESIFEVQFMEGSAGFAGSFMYAFLPRPMAAEEVAPITRTSNPQPLSEEGNNIPTPDIIAAYEPGDERLDASIAYVTLSGSLRANKRYPYIKKYAKPHAVHLNTGTNWPVYRYSEALLFLAEALTEENKTSQAAPYINMVRKRAGLSAVRASTQSAMREAIYKERRVELAFENKRWPDLVRTGRVQSVISAHGAKIIANPSDYYYPAGAVPPNNAFTNLEERYALPADESVLSPHF